VTTQVVAEFIPDLQRLATAELHRLGLKVQPKTVVEALVIFANFYKRRIEPRPRQVFQSDTLVNTPLPTELQPILKRRVSVAL
jgi:hypothetical protein